MSVRPSLDLVNAWRCFVVDVAAREDDAGQCDASHILVQGGHEKSSVCYLEVTPPLHQRPTQVALTLTGYAPCLETRLSGFQTDRTRSHAKLLREMAWLVIKGFADHRCRTIHHSSIP